MIKNIEILNLKNEVNEAIKFYTETYNYSLIFESKDQVILINHTEMVNSNSLSVFAVMYDAEQKLSHQALDHLSDDEYNNLYKSHYQFIKEGFRKLKDKKKILLVSSNMPEAIKNLSKYKSDIISDVLVIDDNTIVITSDSLSRNDVFEITKYVDNLYWI